MPPSAMRAERALEPGSDDVASAHVSLGAHLPSVQLDTYEGPLELLLQLVRAGRMDIFDLPILTLCDQYLGYLSSMEELDLNVAGEFLVMAATLLEIKSRLLLPAPPKDAEDEQSVSEFDPTDPRTELVQRLLEYAKYQEIGEQLKQAEADRKLVFFRAATEYSGAFATPPRFGEMSASALLKALQRMMLAFDSGEKHITSVRRQKITLSMKMRLLLYEAQRAGAEGITLDSIIPEPPFAPIEIVLIFLAMLELMKAGSLVVAQERLCGEIRMFCVPEAARSATGDGES